MKQRCPIWIIFAAYLCIWQVPASEQAMPVHVELVPRSSLLVDEGRTLTLAAVRALPIEAFRSMHDNEVNLGFSSSAVWLRVTLPFELSQRADLSIVVPVAVIDHVEVYVPVAGTWKRMLGGDRTAFADRPVLHRHYVFPLPAEMDTRQALFLRVTSVTPLRFSAVLTDKLSFAEREGSRLMVRGFFYGLMVALLIYNLFLWFADRDRSRLYYLGWLMTAVSLTAVMDGMPAHVGWPLLWPSIANETAILLGHLLALSGVLFVRSYLQCRDRAPRIDSSLFVLCMAIATATVAGFVIGGTVAQKLVYGTGAATLAVVGFCILWMGFRRDRQAILLLLTFCGLAPPLILLIARSAGLLDIPVLRDTTMHLGFGLEAVLISIALADRVSILRKQRQAAERELLSGQARFSRQLIRAQEDDRRRFAQELHDGVGQNMLALKTRLDRWSRASTDDEALQIDQIRDMARAAIDSAREISHQLHPGMLERLGLVAALHNLVDSLARDGVVVEVHLDERLNQVAPDHAVNIYRIVQEGIANILKHANASKCELAGILSTESVEITLSDDGVGFEPQTVDIGLGILSMRERAHLIGGTLMLMSPVLQSGSRITIAVPLEHVMPGDNACEC